MLLFLIFILSVAFSLKKKYFQWFVIYMATVSVLCFFYAINNVEAAYQLPGNKPSDSHIYHGAYVDNWNSISNYLFNEYPVVLKVLTFPFVNGIMALYAQSVLLFLLFLTIVKKGSLNANYLFGFIVFNHSVLYTTTSFLKDNFMIWIFLATYFLLRYCKNVVSQIVVIYISLYLMSLVRPFIAYFIPLSIIPLVLKYNNIYLRLFFILSFLAGITYMWVMYGDVFMFVINNWATDYSVGSEGFGPLSIFRVFLGPMPSHYYFYDYFFIQPFVPEKARLLSFIHLGHYALIAFILGCFPFSRLVIIFRQFKISDYYFLGLFFAVFIVYMLAYGSADIRQRAIIYILLFTPFLLSDSFKFKVNIQRFFVSISIFFIITLVTMYDSIHLIWG